MDQKAVWTIKKTNHLKFPYRLTVSKGKRILLDLYTQDNWPGTKGNIFCLRVSEQDDFGEKEIIEQIPVLNYRVYGKKVVIILNRPIKKRCNFLFLTKSYKHKPGQYEQIFWQTQQGLTQRRPKYKLAYNRKENLSVFVDSGERYAWNFPSVKTIKESLPLGDYAIKDEFGILAVIERKTFNDLMKELGNLNKFHQYLSELENCQNSALVIEADYSDFLNQDKIKPYTGRFAVKAIAEIQAFHPNLPIIFSGGRKSAVIWADGFFRNIASRFKDRPIDFLRDSAAKYGQANPVFIEDEIRRFVFNQLSEEFTSRQVKDCFPGVKNPRRVLEKIKNEGLLISRKTGREIIWTKTGRP